MPLSLLHKTYQSVVVVSPLEEMDLPKAVPNLAVDRVRLREVQVQGIRRKKRCESPFLAVLVIAHVLEKEVRGQVLVLVASQVGLGLWCHPDSPPFPPSFVQCAICVRSFSQLRRRNVFKTQNKSSYAKKHQHIIIAKKAE